MADVSNIEVWESSPLDVPPPSVQLSNIDVRGAAPFAVPVPQIQLNNIVLPGGDPSSPNHRDSGFNRGFY